MGLDIESLKTFIGKQSKLFDEVDFTENSSCDVLRTAGKLINNYYTLSKSPNFSEPLFDSANRNTQLEGKFLFKDGNIVGKIVKKAKARHYDIQVGSSKQTVTLILPNRFSEDPSERVVTYNDQPTLISQFRLSLYKPRNNFLWPWCIVNAELTTQPYIENEKDKRTLAGIKLLAIFVNVMIDDLADQIQDTDLVKAFITYINNTLTGNADNVNEFQNHVNGCKSELIDSLSKITHYEAYKDYIELTTQMWEVTLHESRNHIGENFSSLIKDFSSDYADIMHAMKRSVDVSGLQFLQQSPGFFFELEMDLAHNLNMFAFESLDYWYAKEHIDAFSITAEQRETYRSKVLTHIQFMGQTANHLGTFDRELGEGDLTNAVFCILAETDTGFAFDLDMLNTVLPLSKNSVSTHIESSIKKYQADFQLLLHWKIALSIVDRFIEENPKLSKTLHLSKNRDDIIQFTASYLKFFPKAPPSLD